MPYSNYRVRRQTRAEDRTSALAGGGRVLGGAWAGAVAGLVMLGSAVPSRRALGGPAGILAGLLIHLVVSAAWGILFAAILPEDGSAWTALWTGLLYGIGV